MVVVEGDVDSYRVALGFSSRNCSPQVIIVKSPMADTVVQENLGIGHAIGDILCFIDDDAEACSDWLERIEAWYNDPRIGGVGGRDIIYNGDQVIDGESKDVGKFLWYGRVIGNHHLAKSVLSFVDILKGCNMSFRRIAIDGIDTRLIGTHRWEEDLSLTVKSKGYKIMFDSRIQVKHFSKSVIRIGQNKVDGKFLRAVNHNSVYTGLKYLIGLRKLIFVVYSFVWGEWYDLGILRMLIKWIKYGDRAFLLALAPVLQGKVDGIVDYIRYRTRDKNGTEMLSS